jgi:glycine/D-amino acid oxidase-like deaminating enzyme
MNVDGFTAGLYWPDDGDVDPNGITMAMSIGAKKHGAEINTHTQVTGIDRSASGEWVVHTDKGDITCEFVVNAAGLWAPQVAKWWAWKFHPLPASTPTSFSKPSTWWRTATHICPWCAIPTAPSISARRWTA